MWQLGEEYKFRPYLRLGEKVPSFLFFPLQSRPTRNQLSSRRTPPPVRLLSPKRIEYRYIYIYTYTKCLVEIKKLMPARRQTRRIKESAFLILPPDFFRICMRDNIYLC